VVKGNRLVTGQQPLRLAHSDAEPFSARHRAQLFCVSPKKPNTQTPYWLQVRVLFARLMPGDSSTVEH
jgi:hypothetical protein